MAFKLASLYAFRDAFLSASPVVLEPIMTVEVTADATETDSASPSFHPYGAWHVMLPGLCSLLPNVVM